MPYKCPGCGAVVENDEIATYHVHDEPDEVDAEPKQETKPEPPAQQPEAKEEDDLDFSSVFDWEDEDEDEGE